jgi:hypothetical protein
MTTCQVETMEAPQNRRFYGKMEVPLSLWAIYILIRGGLWAKHMGLKRAVIGNTLGEHYWKLYENSLGT